MKKLKTFFKKFSFLLPFQPEPKIQAWFILFNGDFVGSYFGPDLSHLHIERWMNEFPGDPNPIMLTESFEFY